MTCCLVLLVSEFYKNDTLVYIFLGDLFLSLNCMLLHCCLLLWLFHFSLLYNIPAYWDLFPVVPAPCTSLGSALLRNQLYNDTFSESLGCHLSKGYAFQLFSI